ncbi:hypothetical protein FRC06_005602 [Ceratobasidium sp. 370]|nr:hypothetical protein FRC06_005602 [Ceratobasidium sp. 370]
MKQISHELNKTSTRLNSGSYVAMDELSTEQTSQQHRRLAEEWEHLLSRAKRISGFENFLVPKKAADLKLAARTGPVVVINVHKLRCDAIVLFPQAAAIEHICLPNFTLEKACDARSNFIRGLVGSEIRARGDRRPIWVEENDCRSHISDSLAMLWGDVVRPILDHLGYMRIPSSGKRPHITWCTAGPLALLPLHAAGIYNGPEQFKAFEHVISSYTPTLENLLSASLPTGSLSDAEAPSILAVAQPHTKGCAPLPCTSAEVAHIRELATGLRYTELQHEQATTTSVLDAMERHSWVHLACHAAQDPVNPITSGFHLHDGVLGLSSIVQRSFKNKGLAFLSACQTATGDEKIPGEAIHLAAGMLVAGYRNVIATLWSIKDEDAPLVAEQVYARLLKDGNVGSEEVAEALHDAVGALRRVVGEKAFDRWVPYIHIGG